MVVYVVHEPIGTWCLRDADGYEVAFTISGRAMASKLADGSRERHVDLSRVPRGKAIRVDLPVGHPALTPQPHRF